MRQVKPASPTADDAARPHYLGFVRLRRKGLSNGLRCQMLIPADDERGPVDAGIAVGRVVGIDGDVVEAGPFDRHGA